MYVIVLLTITKKSNNLIEPAVSSAVAYGRCIVSYSRGARLDGMNNKCELLLKHRDCRKAKDY